MPSKPLRVAILAMPGVQLLDVSGPLDVFAEANAQAGRTVYELCVLATRTGAIRSSSGVRLMPDTVIGESVNFRIDTLLVAGAPNAADVPADGQVVDWLRRATPSMRRYGSVCSGAFFLAQRACWMESKPRPIGR